MFNLIQNSQQQKRPMAPPAKRPCNGKRSRVLNGGGPSFTVTDAGRVFHSVGIGGDELLQPDFTVIVGGKEFHHYSQMLRSGSRFFNRMIDSTMKETTDMKVEIHDCDPNDWEVVSSFFQPEALSQGRKHVINESNVEMLIPWFDKIMADSLLKKCDIVYCDKVFGSRRFCKRQGLAVGCLTTAAAKLLNGEMLELLDVLEFSASHSLQRTTSKSCTELIQILTDSPDIFLLGGSALERIVVLCMHYSSCRDTLWPALRRRLPGPILMDSRTADGPPLSLLNHPCEDYFWSFISLVEVCFERQVRKTISAKKATTARRGRVSFG